MKQRRIVIALAVVSLAIRAIQPLYQTSELLIIAYAIPCLPLAMVRSTNCQPCMVNGSGTVAA